jgi:co-chaperonin GroES (HSP10)
MTKPAFAPHRLDKNQIRAIKKDIIVTDMVFDERISQGGIILPNDNGTSKGIRPRWGQVYAVGPAQQVVTVGQWVCVAHGRWTRGLDIEDESGKRTIRKIDPKDILLVANERPMDTTFSDAIHVDKKPDDMLHN